MQPELKIITQEIPAKGKGYFVIQKCWPDQIDEAVRQGARSLLEQGATQIYAASTDPAAPLAEGSGAGYRLEFRHDMLRMERSLRAPDGPGSTLRLTLEPLRREKSGQWLALYNAAFFDVPNSATYGRSDLERVLGDGACCGFALLDGVCIGIYELSLDEIPEIEGIGLDKDYRGRGLGRELLLSAMEYLAQMEYERCCLRVSTANESAYSLYRAAGFTQTKLLSHWYEVISEGDLRA